MQQLTADRLRQLVHYDPLTGEFRWQKQISSHAIPGRLAGTVSKHNGYLHIAIDKKIYRAHRLAWLYVHGEWPIRLDHRNRVRTDNRIANLRLASISQNKANSRLRHDNASGFKGAYRRNDSGRYQAAIRFEGRLISLGCYETAIEAHRAYITKAREVFGEFAHPG